MKSAILLFLSLGGLSAQSVSFYHARVDTLAGIYTQALAAGDLNGDGKMDVVVADSDGAIPPANSVFVFLSNGDGSFVQSAAFNPFPFGAPGNVVLADFNRDGKLDIAVASGDVLLYFGNGDGTFQTPVTVTADVSEIVAVDLNHDGKLDLAGTDTYYGNVAVLIGNGDGTFQPETDYPVNKLTGFIAAANLNGGGGPDLITAVKPGSLAVLINNGDGTFAAAVEYPSGGSPVAVAVADYNKDGRADLLVANSSSFNLLLGNGDGTFGEAALAASGTDIGGVIASDFNHDGSPGFIGTTSAGVLLFPSNNMGGFDTPLTLVAGDEPTGLLETDLNGDGIKDLVVANNKDSDISAWIGDLRASSFRIAPRQKAGSGACAAAAGDFNGDGNLDLAVADGTANAVRLLLGSGKGTFEPLSSIAAGAGPCGIVVADFNHDGIPDIATTNQTDNTVSILIGLGEGVFLPAVDYPVGLSPRQIFAADLHNNGKLDLVIANTGERRVSLLRGNGNGTFQPATSLLVPGGIPSITVADFNNDGKLDLVVSCLRINGQTEEETVFYPGNGDGTFGAGIQVSEVTSVKVSSVAAVDLNHDGNLDLVTSDSPFGDVYVHLGNGDGTFQLGVIYSGVGTPGGQTGLLAIGDFNNDGNPDVVVTNPQPNDVSILLGNGDGTLQGPVSFGVGLTPASILVGAFNGDIRPDIVTANSGDSTVSILLNQSLP